MRLLLGVVLVVALTACTAHKKLESSGKVVIVQIDEMTLGSKDPVLHQYPLPNSVIRTAVAKLKDMGAKVVVDEASAHLNPTEAALHAVQQYRGTQVASSSLALDSNGQLSLDKPPEFVVHVRTERGAQVEERIPSFAQVLSFSDLYRQPASHLRQLFNGKIVYLGYTASGAAHPPLFDDARLADQLLAKGAGEPEN